MLPYPPLDMCRKREEISYVLENSTRRKCYFWSSEPALCSTEIHLHSMHVAVIIVVYMQWTIQPGVLGKHTYWAAHLQATNTKVSNLLSTNVTVVVILVSVYNNKHRVDYSDSISRDGPDTHIICNTLQKVKYLRADKLWIQLSNFHRVILGRSPIYQFQEYSWEL